MAEIIEENTLKQDLMGIRDERTPSGITAKRMGRALLQMLEYSTQQGKVVKRGALFSTEADLLKTYPTPEVGDYAYVGTVPNTIIYRCQVKGTWLKTSETWNGGNVDVSGYVEESSLMYYDCSKGGEVSFESLETAIAAVPAARQKGGLTIYFVLEGTNETQRFTLKTSTWSTDVGNWQQETHVFAQGEGDSTTMGISQAAYTVGMNKASSSTTTLVNKVKEDILDSLDERDKVLMGKVDSKDNEIKASIKELVIPKVVYLTQEAYDALKEKDPDTTYLCPEE